MSAALELLRSVESDLIADLYRAALTHTPWPAGVPVPTDAELDAFENLDAGLECGLCDPGRCVCDVPPAWPVYDAFRDSRAAQAALRTAYDRAYRLLPEPLQPAGWVDPDVVLAAVSSLVPEIADETLPLPGESTSAETVLTEPAPPPTTVAVEYGTTRAVKGDEVPTVTVSHGKKSVTIEGEQSVRVFRKAHEAKGAVVKWMDFVREDLARRGDVVEAALEAARANRRQEAEGRDPFFEDEDAPPDGLDIGLS